MKKRLIDIALGVLFFGVVIAALQFIVLAPAKERAKARTCYSKFEQILLASRDYAREHGTGYQTNLICLSNQLFSPQRLLCVEDELRHRRVREKATVLEGNGSAGHWARLTMDDCSYEAFLRDSNTLVLRCPFHKISMRTVGEIWDGYKTKSERDRSGARGPKSLTRDGRAPLIDAGREAGVTWGWR